MIYFITVFLAIFAFISIRNLKWGIFIILTALPSYLIRFKFLGIPVTALEMMILVIFTIWLFKNFQFSILKKFSVFSFLLSVFIFLFFISATAGIFVSPDLRQSLGIWKAYFVEPILLFIVLISEFRGARNFKFIVSALSISAFYISIYAILQRFFGIPIPAPWQAEMRVTSIFPYPNAVGLFLAPVIPLFIHQLISNFYPFEASPAGRQFSIFKQFSISKFLKICFWSLMIILSVVSIYFAKTEAALVALVVGLFFFLLFYSNKTRLTLIFIIFLFFIFYFLFPSNNLFLAIENKLLLGDWSGKVRLTIWAETWQMLKDKPILGAGLAGYQTAILPYHKAEWMEIFLYPHNIIFNFWSEIGIMGLLSFIAMVIYFFISIIKLPITHYQLPIKFKMTKLLIALSMVVLLIHGLVDVPYFKNDLSVLFWTIMCLPIIIKGSKICLEH